MCVYSMIMDHYWDKWHHPPYYSPPPIFVPSTQPATSPAPIPFTPQVPAITKEEIEEFRKLLERAREYDRKNNEPECELEEKKERIRKLAKELGIEITLP